MQTYKEFAPTSFDSTGLCGDRLNIAHWLVAPVSITRDSGLMDQSNYRVMLNTLYSECVDSSFQIHRFGHWACGWFEIVLVDPKSHAETVASEIESALADYPVLNDHHYSELEYEAICEYWDNIRLSEKIEHCRERGESIFAARRVSAFDLPDSIVDDIRDSVTS